INDINIGRAVRASCSFPGVFCPVNFKNDILVDGGIRENIPWKEAKKNGIDKVLCIVFEEQKKYKKDKNIIDTIIGSIVLMRTELSYNELVGADYVLNITTDAISLLEPSKIDHLYEQGYYQSKSYLGNWKCNGNIKN